MADLLLLGGLDLTGADGRPVHSVISHPKSAAVLAYLALAAPGRFLSRDRLLSVFWPESDEARARNALSQILHRLRQGLGGSVIRNRGKSGLSLSTDGLWCDATAFADAVEAGEYGRALGLYSGHLLEGFHLCPEPGFEDWVARERTRLREMAARSAWAVAHRHIDEGRLTDAERTGQRALDLVCTDENEVRRFISALAGTGDRAAVVRFYERFAKRLRRDLELEPDPSIQVMMTGIRIGQGPTGSTAPLQDPRPSIAALPWVNRSGRQEDLYFTDGIHEEILGRLSGIGGLRVIARPSVMRFRESNLAARDVAAELGVRYLLGAGLLRAQDKVRINVQLMDTELDHLIWAETFDRSLSMETLLSVQSEIAHRVATELEAALTPEEEARIQAPLTGDLEAYDLYLLGRHRWVTRSSDMLRRAIRYYQAAIEQDPTFALAWTGLADAWTALPWYEPIPALDAYARAREAAQRALELDDALAEAHTARGGQAFYYEWDWDRAEAHLRRALELNPNYAQAHQWLSMVQSVRGHLDQAIESIERGISLNPLGNNFHGSLAAYLFCAGRTEEALLVFRKAETFDPPTPMDLLSMALVLSRQELPGEASRVIRRWGASIGYPRPERLPLVIRAFSVPELTGEALAILEDLRKATGLQAGFLACLYLSLNAPAETLNILKEAIAQRHATVPFLGMTRYFPKLSTDPDLAAALREAGIPIR